MELATLITNMQITTVIAAALMITLASIATAFGFAMLGGKFLESIARQPELSQMLMMRMFLMAGLVDAFAAISIAIGLMLIFGKNPLLSAVVSAVSKKAGVS